MAAHVSRIVNLRLGILHNDLEIAPVLVFIPDAFRIFLQLGGVVGSGEDVFQENRVGHANGPQVLHGVTQHARIDVLVALEPDLAHLDLRTFFDHKRDADCGRRNLPHFGPHRGKLPAMFRQQTFDRHFRFLHFRGIVLTLHRQSDLRFLEAVQDVAGGNRTMAYVGDLADGRLLLDLDNQPPTLGSLFPGKADILEVAGVPQRIEIALQRGGVIDITRMGEDARLDRFCGNPAVALNVDLRDDVGLRPTRGGGKQNQCDSQRPPESLHSPAKPCK